MNLLNLNKFLSARYLIIAVVFTIFISGLFYSNYRSNLILSENQSQLDSLSVFQNSIDHIQKNYKEYTQSAFRDTVLSRINLIKSFSDLKIFAQIKISAPQQKRDFIQLYKSIESNCAYLQEMLAGKTLIDSQKMMSIISKTSTDLRQLRTIYSKAQKTHIESSKKTNTAIWIGSLIILHLIIIFVFRPVSRTINTTINKLENKKTQAVAADRTKSEYLTVLSHEIRTPLNGVLGLSNLLKETKLTKDQEEYVNLILTSGENLLKVVNDIFDFTKIESGNMALEEMYFSIRKCVEDIVEEFLPKAVDKNLVLLYFIEPDIPENLLGDYRSVRQCLSNLVSNSVKFSREGEIFIRVNLLNVSDNIYEIQISVSDKGIGIPESKIQNLFNPFEKSEAPIAKKFRGTGLGLPITARIVELMKGRIWVESEISKGSTFYIAIPFESKKTLQKGIPDQSLLQQKHILIMHPEETRRKVLAVQCNNWGMFPKTISKSHEIADTLKSNSQIEFVVLDHDSIKGDEDELIKTLNNSSDLKHVHLIFLMSPEQIKKTKKTKDFTVLQKPVKNVQLYEALTELVSKQESKRKSSSKAKGRITKKSPKMLLAEDNAINQTLIVKSLKKMGYSIDLAKNGQIASEMARKVNYDIIFMDLQMPEMDGIEATRTILRSVAVDKQPKIVAMTANVSNEDKEICFEAGMVDYIAKPVNLRKLQDLIENWT